MTKVYLLLRNNKQSGPHSLEELLKLGLKPLDLIWIEGRSAGWSYPSEINALKQYVIPPAEAPAQLVSEKKSENNTTGLQSNNQAYMPPEKQVPVNRDATVKPKVYVSMPASANRPVEAQVKTQEAESVKQEPADKIEQKAEELRKRIQSYVPDKKPDPKVEEPLVTKYSSTIPEREEAYTSWIYDKKVSNANKITAVLQKKGGAIAIAVLLILIVGYGISQYHSDNKEVEQVASTATATPDANAKLPEPLITEPETPATQPITNNVSPNSTPDNTVVQHSSETSKKNYKVIVATDKKTIAEKHKVTLVTVVDKKSVATKPAAKEVTEKPTVEAKSSEVKVLPKNETEPVAVTGKKKKTLNQKIDAFFSKLSKKVEATPVSEAPPKADNSTPNTFPGTVERKAVHRDDSKPVVTSAPAPAPTVTNLAEYVELTSNKPSENWMLGVHGLKVSLHNTSSEIVKTAAVELRYYTEQNEVLEKKIVNFSNIPPGKTVTLPAPDHRLADHADFRLVTAR